MHFSILIDQTEYQTIRVCANLRLRSMQLPWSRGRDFFSELGEGSLHVMVAIQAQQSAFPAQLPGWAAKKRNVR